MLLQEDIDMENMKEFYILLDSIETEIGTLRFVKVKEYPIFIKHLQYLLLEKGHLLKLFKQSFDLDENVKLVYEHLKETTLFDFVKLIGRYKIKFLGLYQIYQGYVEAFKFFFNEDVFYKIKTNEEFEYYKELICQVNAIPYERPNPNPEIERFNRFRRLLKRKKSENISFESMYTSVWAYLKHCPDDLTLYQFNRLFHRIARFKDFDMNTIFATVSKEVKIEPWCKDLEEDVKEYLDEKDLNIQRNL